MVNIKRIKLGPILFETDVYIGKAYINKLKKNKLQFHKSSKKQAHI